MQRWIALFTVGTLISHGSGALVASAEASTASAEAVAVVEQAYEQWYSRLGIRQLCSSGVSIVFEALPSRRGEYRTATQQVVIDPGDKLEGVAGIVIHELSHHTSLGCGAFADATFTEAFYTAQGLAVGRDWFDYSAGWTQTPAEHFAEALTVTISGNSEGGIPVNSETVEVITRWLAGVPQVRIEFPPVKPPDTPIMGDDSPKRESNGRETISTWVETEVQRRIQI